MSHEFADALPDQRSDQPCYLYAIPRSDDRVHFGKTRHPIQRSRTHARHRWQISLEEAGWELWWAGNENEERLLHRYFHDARVEGPHREEFHRTPEVNVFLERMWLKPYVAHDPAEAESVCYPTQDWFPWSERHLYEGEQMVLVDGHSRAYIPRDAEPGSGRSSLQEDYYTPADHMACVRTALGHIDLDPASSRIANKTVQARHIWTRHENGLVQPWGGRVFLNPPYGDEGPRFVAKLLAEFQAGRVEAAITLLRVGAFSGTSWFQGLWDFPQCILPNRVRFMDPLTNERGSPDHGSIFTALGVDAQHFARSFEPLGGRVFLPLTEVS